MFKRLLISISLVLNKYFGSNDQSQAALMEVADQVEPQRQWSEWDQMMHVDDVTSEEAKILMDLDHPQRPELIEEVMQRQAEFEALWNDPDERRRRFYQPIRDAQPKGTEPKPMEEKEGWGDDGYDEEWFTYLNPKTNLLERIPFKDHPDWQNQPADQQIPIREQLKKLKR